jgi:ATP-binding protein involved in chromosome partitioning
MAVGDALKGARMFERVNVPVLGIVENMSGFTDPETGRRFTFFAEGGGKRLAEELGLPLLGEVPLQPGLAEDADQGRPVVVSAPDSAAAKSLRNIAERLHAEASKKTFSLPVIS